MMVDYSPCGPLKAIRDGSFVNVSLKQVEKFFGFAQNDEGGWGGDSGQARMTEERDGSRIKSGMTDGMCRMTEERDGSRIKSEMTWGG